MKSSVQLESKDIRMIIAKFLGLRLEDVIPNRYNFCVTGISAEQIMVLLDDVTENAVSEEGA